MTTKIKRAPTAAQEITGFMLPGQRRRWRREVVSSARAVKRRWAVTVNSRMGLDNSTNDSPTEFNGHLPNRTKNRRFRITRPQSSIPLRVIPR
jgi:hypothetical protein